MTTRHAARSRRHYRKLSAAAAAARAQAAGVPAAVLEPGTSKFLGWAWVVRRKEAPNDPNNC